MQGGGDSTSQDGPEEQISTDRPEVPTDRPEEVAPVRLGRSRAWNRPGLSGAGARAVVPGEGDTAEDEPTGTAPVSTDAIPPATPAGTAMELSPIFRNWSDPAASANTPERCHFLRGISDNGRLVDPQTEAIPTHRCAAFGEPLPLSMRQQELVCLQRVHVSCPRYLRGALLASESATEPAVVRTQRRIPRTAAIGLVLILAAALVGGAAASGLVPGLGGGSGQTQPIVDITNAPSATATAVEVAVNPTADAVPSSTPVSTPSPSPTPSPTPVPTASPSPTAWPACPPGAKGGRLTCVVPCPDQASCYEYMIHTGDKLNEIAFYFGVTMQDLWAMNPWLQGTTKIATGEILRLPPPTK